MRKIKLYIAQSLDGFIAGPNGELDWLMSLQNPNKIDHGYNKFFASVDEAIMGRKTYDDVLSFDVPWPYKGHMTYVFTSRDKEPTGNKDVTFVAEHVASFAKKLKEKKGKDIWLIGGGKLITSFLNENLVDEMIISIIAKIIGTGLPLFAPIPRTSEWELVGSESFETGVVNISYVKK